MKKFLLAISIVIMSFFACSPKVTSADTYGASIHTENIGKQAIKATKLTLDRPGFNKECKKEGISSNLKNWAQAVFKTYETSEPVIEYYYIKEDDKMSNVYRLDLDIVKKDTTFVFEIRRTILHNR